MCAVVVLAHALRHFSQQAVREISDQANTPLSNDDIRWVVTVPAIWTAAAKQLMRQAAYDVSHHHHLLFTIKNSDINSA